MNAKQAAAILDISSRGLYALAAPYGPIPCYRIGRRIVFNEADVVAFKESQKSYPGQAGDQNPWPDADDPTESLGP